MKTVNHFVLIAEVAGQLRSVNPGLMKVNVRDIGSPSRQFYRITGPTAMLAPLHNATTLYVEGHLSLQEWTHPRSGSHLATLQINARYVTAHPRREPLNVWSVVSVVKAIPPLKPIGNRVMGMLICAGDGGGQTIYVYDHLARRAAQIPLESHIFAQGVASLQHNPTSRVIYRLRMDAQMIGDPDCPEAMAARDDIRRRSW